MQGPSPWAERSVSEHRDVSGKCLYVILVVFLLNERNLGLPTGCGPYIPGDGHPQDSSGYSPEHPALGPALSRVEPGNLPGSLST